LAAQLQQALLNPFLFLAQRFLELLLALLLDVRAGLAVLQLSASFLDSFLELDIAFALLLLELLHFALMTRHSPFLNHLA